jgi:hypothetical protein
VLVEKLFTDLKVGDTVWMHRAPSHDGCPSLFRGEVSRRARGYIHVGSKKVALRITNTVWENDTCRFVYGEYSTSVLVYASKDAAVLGLWALTERARIASCVGLTTRVSHAQLLQIAEYIGFAPLPEE